MVEFKNIFYFDSPELFARSFRERSEMEGMNWLNSHIFVIHHSEDKYFTECYTVEVPIYETVYCETLTKERAFRIASLIKDGTINIEDEQAYKESNWKGSPNGDN